MKAIKHLGSLILVLLLAGLLVSQIRCQSEQKKYTPAKLDIIDTAAVTGNFTTLIETIKTADLMYRLKGEGPFTVFAPTDKAFAKLPNGTLDDLLEPENKQRLVSILSYHVISGKVMASDVVELSSARTLNAQSLSIKVEDGVVKVDSATIIHTDIKCSNGVIHIIDNVMLPD